MKERRPLLREAVARYRKTAGRKEKSAMLDELAGYTGMNRKVPDACHGRRERETRPQGRRQKTERRRQEAGLLRRVHDDPAVHLGVLLVPVRSD